MRYPNGLVYEGGWKNNVKEGFGVLYSPDSTIIYQGEWKNDVFSGRGVLNNLKKT